MIVYPLQPPALPGPSSIVFSAVNVVGMAQSPYTAETQVQEWPGEYLTLDVSLPPMKRPNAEQWIAFLMALRGIAGTFVFGDASNKSLLGSGSGTPVVMGNQDAGSKELMVNGWSPSSANVLKAGDYFQLGDGSQTRIYKNLTDADSDGSGITILDIFPRLRGGVDDGDPVILTNPRGLFRLASNERKWSVNAASIYGIQFTAVEAIGNQTTVGC